MLDEGTIARILARQGAPDTPENRNSIIQFAASDPSVLERYSMGTAPAQMQGTRDVRGGSGLDDNAALLSLNRAIDNSIQRTELPPPPQAAAPPPAAPAPAPRRTTPSNRGRAGTAAGTEPDVPPQGNAGTASPGVEPSTGAPMPGQSGQEGAIRIPTPDYTSGGAGFDWKWLIPAILGPAAAGVIGKTLFGQGTTPDQGTKPPQPDAQRAPAPYGTDIQRPPADKPVAGSPAVPLSDPARSSPAGVPSGQSQADIEALKAQVEAERAADALKLQDQIRASATRNANTELINAARRATGRR